MLYRFLNWKFLLVTSSQKLAQPQTATASKPLPNTAASLRHLCTILPKPRTYALLLFQLTGQDCSFLRHVTEFSFPGSAWERPTFRALP